MIVSGSIRLFDTGLQRHTGYMRARARIDIHVDGMQVTREPLPFRSAAAETNDLNEIGHEGDARVDSVGVSRRPMSNNHLDRIVLACSAYRVH